MALLASRLFGVPYVYDMDSGLARQMADRFRWLAPGRGASSTPASAWRCAGAAGPSRSAASLEDQARACHPAALVARLEDVTLLGPAHRADDRAAR